MVLPKKMAMAATCIAVEMTHTTISRPNSDTLAYFHRLRYSRNTSNNRIVINAQGIITRAYTRKYSSGIWEYLKSYRPHSAANQAKTIAAKS